jgi:hypothetical protein
MPNPAAALKCQRAYRASGQQPLAYRMMEKLPVIRESGGATKAARD